MDKSAAERRHVGLNYDDVSPLWGYVLCSPWIPWLTPWATDLAPLRGWIICIDFLINQKPIGQHSDNQHPARH